MNKDIHKCRLCLKLGDFGSIFDQDDSVKLSDMVMSFANIQIYEGDGLSDRVCLSCIENLSTAYLFKLQCERINNLLRKSPELQIDQPPTSDFNDFLNHEFHMHCGYDSMESENDKNSSTDTKTRESSGNGHEISDETDSDIDSIKCVYCNEAHNNFGAHTCNVTCTIEHNELQQSSSNETLVAADITACIEPTRPTTPVTEKPLYVNVSCVLCEEKYDQFQDYASHLNRCTRNVKLQHYVCPVCHEIYTEKLPYLLHLKSLHFNLDANVNNPTDQLSDPGIDCIDIAPRCEKTRRPKAVRRQIGWSIEDIYQEIVCTKAEEKQTPTTSPFKNFFSKFGNESLSKQSTPKRVSFRNFIENSKAKTSSYFPFKKYIDNYKLKRKDNEYSPLKGKMQVSSQITSTFPETTSDSDYNSPSGTSEESWKLKQNLICACDKKVFMLSEFINDRDRIVSMINELGGIVAENTKMEMLATHFISMLPNDTFTGMMVCALATGKWLLHVSFIYDSFRCKEFLSEDLYEWMKHPKLLEIDNTSVNVAKVAVYWHHKLQARGKKFPFEGKQIVLIMKKKYRQYYQMIFKTLKAKIMTYDPRTPGSCCTADYCFVDIKVIQMVKLHFFAYHNVPVFPYQYILVYLLNKGGISDERKYLLQDYKRIRPTNAAVDYLNNTY